MHLKEENYEFEQYTFISSLFIPAVNILFLFKIILNYAVESLGRDELEENEVILYSIGKQGFCMWFSPKCVGDLLVGIYINLMFLYLNILINYKCIQITFNL